MQKIITEDLTEKRRLSKQVSLISKFSRNEAEKLIHSGKVFVNGEKITSATYFVENKDKIEIKGFETGDVPSKIKIIALNKPRGLVVSKNDEKGRSTIYSILPRQFSSYVYVGRLDMNTEGLILLTNNSKVAHELEDPKNQFEREYEVRVFGILNEEKIKRMERGVSIDGMHYKAKSVRVKKRKTDDSKNTWLTVILDTGKNREVRKLMEFFNLKVNRLLRVRYANVNIAQISTGSYMELHQRKISQVIQDIEQKCGKKITF